MNMNSRKYRKRTGRCYELAWRTVLESDGLTLVHGQCNGPEGQVIDHAWIECSDGSVLDEVLNASFAGDEYARKYGAIVIRRYSKEEAAKKSLETGHYGPWY